MQNDFNQAEFVASRFGGRRRYADAIDEKYPNVDYWCRVTKFIPENRRLRTLQEAQVRGIDLTPFDFIRHLVVIPAGATVDG